MTDLRIMRNRAGRLCCPIAAGQGRTVELDYQTDEDGTGMWTCPDDDCGLILWRDEEGNEPRAEKFEPRPDEELLDELSDLEDGVEYTVRARCVGHPFGSGGGCGWEGTATIVREERHAHGATQKGPVMPLCPSCGGWAEPVRQGGKLRAVK